MPLPTCGIRGGHPVIGCLLSREMALSLTLNVAMSASVPMLIRSRSRSSLVSLSSNAHSVLGSRALSAKNPLTTCAAVTQKTALGVSDEKSGAVGELDPAPLINRFWPANRHRIAARRTQESCAKGPGGQRLSFIHRQLGRAILVPLVAIAGVPRR